jgi:opacity protein-like surface antigen
VDAGGGLEYAFAQHWTFKAEYLYVSLESESVTESAVALFIHRQLQPHQFQHRARRRELPFLEFAACD